MNPLLSLIVCCVPGQSCTAEAFPEWILFPFDHRGRTVHAIAVDSRGSFVAFSTDSACPDDASCSKEPCCHGFVGHLFDCSLPGLREFTTGRPPYPGLGAAAIKATDGSFLLLWSPDNCIYRRAFDSQGVPLFEKEALFPEPCRGGFRGSGHSNNIRLAAHTEGNYFGGWDAWNGDDIGAFSTIRTRKLDHLGNWLGPEFLLHPDDHPDIMRVRALGYLGALCTSENGRVLVVAVWRNSVEWGPDRFTYTVTAWLLDSDLRLLREPIVVTRDAYPACGYNGNCAAMDAEGNFVVVWEDVGQALRDNQGPPMDQILAQRFTKDGDPLGPRIEASGPPLRNLQYASSMVVMAPDGRFTVAWHWYNDGLITGQRFTRDGEFTGRRFQINVYPQTFTFTAASDGGDLLAVVSMLGRNQGDPGSVAARVIDLTAQEFIRGDANESGEVDISDAIAILEYLFLGGEVRPVVSAADANDDGRVEITDALHVLFHLFVGGREFRIPHPYPIWGFDPTPNEG